MVTHNYQELISIENLFQAWDEFKKGKRKRKDVRVYERNLEDNLFDLHESLKNTTYKHGNYLSFYVQDPKQRHIHKANVTDRIVHHLLYKYLYEIFDETFIYDSYSCRLEKGTHKAVKRLVRFTRIVSKNYTKDCWALKLDIKKFFASVNHQILKNILANKIADKDILWLLSEVIDSFCSCHPSSVIPSEQSSRGNLDLNKIATPFGLAMTIAHKGIPLGNLTSQVFANIYMNELDQFIKHDLKVRYYIRYADDFLILSGDKDTLQRLTVTINQFLWNNLKLELHPKKIILRKLNWGIDFLGYIVLPHYILPRTKTKRRIFKKLKNLCSNDLNHLSQSLQSYLGYLSHAESFKVRQELISISPH